MSQGIMLFISACLIAVVVAKDDGNALSKEFPSSETNHSRVGSLHIVPPAATKLQSLEKVAPIEITRDSVPFPTLSPADRKRHMEVLKEFELHLQHDYKDSYPKGEGQDNQAEEAPQIDISSPNDLHGNDN